MSIKWSLFLLTSTLCILLGCVSVQEDLSPRPSPELHYSQVMRIQLAALANLPEEEAVALVYSFTTPEVRSKFSSISKFAVIFDDPQFTVLLDPVQTIIHQGESWGPVATQVVEMSAPDGSSYSFTFILKKQKHGAFADCWLIEAIQAVEIDRGLKLPITKTIHRL